MRLEFQILWFENQPDDVKTQREEIEDHLRESGFSPRIQMEIDASNLDDLAREQQKYDDFDLVVVDFDLGNPKMNGDQVAQQVRRNFGFTDIIFYSGTATDELRRRVHEKSIDGVYCMHRTDISNRLSAHIDQTVRRMSRLETMRGLSVGTVGKCDDEFRRLLSAAYEKAAPDRQADIVRILDELVADGVKVARERYGESKTFADRIGSRAVTSFHLQKLALAVLKGDPALGEYRTLLGRYDKEVLTPRNTLGHAIEIRGESGWEVRSGTTTAITNSDFPKLRQDMAVHFGNICSIRPFFEV